MDDPSFRKIAEVKNNLQCHAEFIFLTSLFSSSPYGPSIREIIAYYVGQLWTGKKNETTSGR